MTCRRIGTHGNSRPRGLPVGKVCSLVLRLAIASGPGVGSQRLLSGERLRPRAIFERPGARWRMVQSHADHHYQLAARSLRQPEAGQCQAKPQELNRTCCSCCSGSSRIRRPAVAAGGHGGWARVPECQCQWATVTSPRPDSTVLAQRGYWQVPFKFTATTEASCRLSASGIHSGTILVRALQRISCTLSTKFSSAVYLYCILQFSSWWHIESSLFFTIEPNFTKVAEYARMRTTPSELSAC
jgi:hypothetical protein